MTRLATGLLAAGLVFGACASEAPAGDVSATSNLSFSPEETTVSVGDTVTWTIDGSQPHSITAYEDEIPEGAAFFSSGGAEGEDEARDEVAATLLDDGETFEVTFEVAGTYRYFCIPHEGAGMTGVVIVEE